MTELSPLTDKTDRDRTPQPARYLYIAGAGAVGGTLSKQLSDLPKANGIRLVGLCNSRTAAFSRHGIPAASAASSLAGGALTDWEEIFSQLDSLGSGKRIFVDATGSEEIARIYPRLIENGIHIVTPSKLSNTFEQSWFDELHRLARQQDVSYRYETTVGAGLPVLSTLEDLVDSGDSVTSITGVVSGTMTYLFTRLEQGTPFSKAVFQARRKGYSEPDPREDLSGEDVVRKFMILARCLGYRLEREDIEVESLIPEECMKLKPASFLKGLAERDSYWERRKQRAEQYGNTLRYVGSLSGDGSVEVGIREVPLDSPMGQLRGTDNLISIRTRRYSDSPVVIQGPGAGKEVTAAGIIGDILKI